MKRRSPLWWLICGFSIALGAMLWPIRSEQGTWAVTVGDRPTKYVPVRGGRLVTPLHLITDGIPEEASALGSAVEDRARLALLAASAGCMAGLVEVFRRGYGHQPLFSQCPITCR